MKSPMMNKGSFLGLFLLISVLDRSVAKPTLVPAENLAALKSQDFQERERAEQALLLWARQQPNKAVTTELLKQSRHAEDPEVRERCLSVLRALVMDEYLKDGEGYLGIMMGDAVENVPGDPRARSVIHVLQVIQDSAAQKSGLLVNDVIVGLDELVWHEGNARIPFSETIRSKKPNSKVILKVIRNQKLIQITVLLGRRPPLQINPLFNDPTFDPEAIERADKEAYFRRWLSERKVSD